MCSPLQVVINNAGVLGDTKPFGEVTEKVLQDVFQVGSCASLHQHDLRIQLLPNTQVRRTCLC